MKGRNRALIRITVTSRILIRIRIKVTSRILIRIKVMRIRNTGKETKKKLRGMIFSRKRRKEKKRNAKEAPEQF